MDTDYEQQLLDNKTEKKTAIDNSNAAYDKTINDYKDEVDSQQQQLKDYEAAQKDLLQEQTDFAIKKINQQKEQAEKDYTKEQQAAYGDYKRQTDPYGVNAEQMAALGLSRSGYSESSKVAMYTAYQNRVAVARASFEQAKTTFDNAIREAKLTNDINLAKIAQEVLEKKLALSMESVVYLGNLELEKAAKASAIEQTYYDREQEIREAQQEALQGGMIGGDGETDEAMKTALAGAYPSGVIADEDVWNALVEEYGEETVRDWGYQPANQGTTPDQQQQPQYTDEYTLLVEEYERLRDAYLSAQRTYEAVTKWGPSPEHKAALEAAEKAYKDYPVKVNEDYEPQKKRVEKARSELWNAQNAKPRKAKDVQKAEKKYQEELAIFNNMKPYIITQKGNSSNGGTLSMPQRDKLQASTR